MQKGTSLAEALICLCLIAIMTGLAMPAWQQMKARQQLTELRDTLQQDFAYARTQAVVLQVPVAIAPLQIDCWHCGWRVWIDGDGNGQMDTGETETLSKPHTHNLLKIVGNTPLRQGAVYHGDGTARRPNGAFLAATFILCHYQLTEQHSLVISRSGRLRARKMESGCL